MKIIWYSHISKGFLNVKENVQFLDAFTLTQWVMVLPVLHSWFFGLCEVTFYSMGSVVYLVLRS